MYNANLQQSSSVRKPLMKDDRQKRYQFWWASVIMVMLIVAVLAPAPYLPRIMEAQEVPMLRPSVELRQAFSAMNSAPSTRRHEPASGQLPLGVDFDARFHIPDLDCSVRARLYGSYDRLAIDLPLRYVSHAQGFAVSPPELGWVKREDFWSKSHAAFGAGALALFDPYPDLATVGGHDLYLPSPLKAFDLGRCESYHDVRVRLLFPPCPSQPFEGILL